MVYEGLMAFFPDILVQNPNHQCWMYVDAYYYQCCSLMDKIVTLEILMCWVVEIEVYFYFFPWMYQDILLSEEL